MAEYHIGIDGSFPLLMHQVDSITITIVIAIVIAVAITITIVVIGHIVVKKKKKDKHMEVVGFVSEKASRRLMD
jgi:hypothetical protein